MHCEHRKTPPSVNRPPWYLHLLLHKAPTTLVLDSSSSIFRSTAACNWNHFQRQFINPRKFCWFNERLLLDQLQYIETASSSKSPLKSVPSSHLSFFKVTSLKAYQLAPHQRESKGWFLLKRNKCVTVK